MRGPSFFCVDFLFVCIQPHVSPASKDYAETTKLRPTDVVVVSFPKTGTTWTQTCCEMLRQVAADDVMKKSNNNFEKEDDGDDSVFYNFDDIGQRQPWLDFAYDCGQNLQDEQIAFPRLFKSHQLLSAVNAGAKYLMIVRDPAATLLSWFDFQKAKRRQGYAEYEDANEYIANRAELFSTNTIFGTNIWEFYTEIWLARNDPSVHILVYEGLIADSSNGYINHLPGIASFLGLSIDDNNKCYRTVANLISRENMVKHVDKFDDHFIAEQQEKHGTALRIMEPAPKVRIGGSKKKQHLSQHTIEWLEDQWLEKVTPITGHSSYDEFASSMAELTATEEEVELDVVEGVNTNNVDDSIDRKSIVIRRRRSSVTIQQMPGLRQRRDSLAPHE